MTSKDVRTQDGVWTGLRDRELDPVSHCVTLLKPSFLKYDFVIDSVVRKLVTVQDTSCYMDECKSHMAQVSDWLMFSNLQCPSQILRTNLVWKSFNVDVSCSVREHEQES